MTSIDELLESYDGLRNNREAESTGYRDKLVERVRRDAAKLALFDRLVEACRESLSFVGDYETGEPLAEKLEALLAEARKLQ